MRKHNHPRYAVHSLLEAKPHLTQERVLEIFQTRGINKWYRTSKLLRALSLRWSNKIKCIDTFRKSIKGDGQKAYAKGYQAAVRDCLQQVKAILEADGDVYIPVTRPGVFCTLPDLGEFKHPIRMSQVPSKTLYNLDTSYTKLQLAVIEDGKSTLLPSDVENLIRNMNYA